MKPEFKINRQSLEAAGYRFFQDHMKGDGCEGLMQKAFLDDNRNKLYFLNVYLWDLSEIIRRPHRSVVVETHFYRTEALSHPGETSIQIEVPMATDATIEKMEAFFADMYKKLDCVPDLHN